MYDRIKTTRLHEKSKQRQREREIFEKQESEAAAATTKLLQGYLIVCLCLLALYSETRYSTPLQCLHDRMCIQAYAYTKH